MAGEVKSPSGKIDTSSRPLMRMFGRGMIAACIVLLAGLGTFLAVRNDFWAGRANERTDRFALNLENRVAIDPRLIEFQHVASIDLEMDQPRGIATGPQDEIFVAGDRSVHIFDANGQRQDTVPFDAPPLCVAVGAGDQPESGKWFAARSDRIDVFSPDHQVLASWPLPDPSSLPTSIAVSGDTVFLADAVNRVVWKLDRNGNVLSQIGKADDERQISGFVIPHRNFDIVAGAEGLLYCVNPGRLQVSVFSFDGDLGDSWGQAGSSIADFFGCCNPVHIARFPDGRFVTSEKGIPRIKVYSATGDLESVVAGPEQLDIEERSLGDPRQGINAAVFDIAVDSRGRVLVLDPLTKCVRVFARVDK